jgi:hypothetical protein
MTPATSDQKTSAIGEVFCEVSLQGRALWRARASAGIGNDMSPGLYRQCAGDRDLREGSRLTAGAASSSRKLKYPTAHSTGNGPQNESAGLRPHAPLLVDVLGGAYIQYSLRDQLIFRCLSPRVNGTSQPDFFLKPVAASACCTFSQPVSSASDLPRGNGIILANEARQLSISR